MKKGLLLILFFLLGLLLKNTFLVKEIEIEKLINIFSLNLHNNEKAVINDKISVLDYYFDNECLYIIPINNEVKLPISGVVTKRDKNIIIIETINGNIYIEGIDSNYYLYQYYNANCILGNSNLISIRSDINEEIVNSLVIDYEAI